MAISSLKAAFETGAKGGCIRGSSAPAGNRGCYPVFKPTAGSTDFIIVIIVSWIHEYYLDKVTQGR